MISAAITYLTKNLWSILLVVATILGAFGGFPQPPQVFQRLTQYHLVQWALVYVLAYQGGAGQNALLALVSTVAIYILYHFIRYFEAKEELIYLD